MTTEGDTVGGTVPSERGALADIVYGHLREGIVVGRYRPNERLVEVALADELAISRTPVREALQRLARERLVVSRRRGWVVHEHTVEEIQEIYEVRMALEGYAARLTAERATQEDRALIESLSEAEFDDSTLTDRRQIVRLNSDFHDAVLNAAHSPRLKELATGNRQYYFNYRLASMYSDSEARDSLTDHRVLAKAIANRDGDLAERAARDHIRTALKIIIDRAV